MANRAIDWLAQARRDLEQAKDSRSGGRHEWACFASHQAAEKAGGVGSDVDLIVIVRESSEPFERRPLAFDLTSLPVPADVFVYTASEWRRMTRPGEPLHGLTGEVVWLSGPGQE